MRAQKKEVPYGWWRTKYIIQWQITSGDDIISSQVSGRRWYVFWEDIGVNPIDTLTKCIDVEKLRLGKVLVGLL